MDGRVCPRCNKTFDLPCRLKRHLARKTPCDPIVVTPGATHSCRYCGRAFTTQQAVSRHVKQYCRIANSSDGMEKLIEHTIQRQLVAVQTQNAEMKAQMTELTTMLKGQLALTQAVTVVPGPTVVYNHAPTTTNVTTNNITQTINIRPWGRGPSDHVVIPASMLRAAFTENPRLAEYCSLTDEDKVDAEQAAPYVVEALVDLVKRAHADPAARNVYLNPRRADQVLVFDETTWKVLSLVEAIKAMFDSIAGSIHRIIQRSRFCSSSSASSSNSKMASVPPVSRARRNSAVSSASAVTRVICRKTR